MSKEKVDLPDNFNPNWVSQKTGSDGDKDTFYGQRGSSNHGHTVQNSNGDIKYARTQGGHVKYDDNNSSSESSSSGSGCFITTATLQAIKSDNDNCDELLEFRKFRDEILLSNPSDKSLVETYYVIAPKIVELINGDKNPKNIYNMLWANYISRGFKLLKAKEYLSAKDLYVTMMKKLVKKYPSVLSAN